jgi:hypothetical protein
LAELANFYSGNPGGNTGVFRLAMRIGAGTDLRARLAPQHISAKKARLAPQRPSAKKARLAPRLLSSGLEGRTR